MMFNTIDRLRQEGFKTDYLNIGGDLRGDQDLFVNSIREGVNLMKLKLILEPGTSLFKDSTVFVSGVVDIQ